MQGGYRSWIKEEAQKAKELAEEVEGLKQTLLPKIDALPDLFEKGRVRYLRRVLTDGLDDFLTSQTSRAASLAVRGRPIVYGYKESSVITIGVDTLEEGNPNLKDGIRRDDMRAQHISLLAGAVRARIASIEKGERDDQLLWTIDEVSYDILLPWDRLSEGERLEGGYRPFPGPKG